jgi:DNA modification methylase
MIVARTKAGRKWDGGSWGSLQGHYGFVTNTNDPVHYIGGKPLPLMQQIIRDYSRPGMLVADPCAGHGTTLVAAKGAGRLVWGAECDPAAHRAACERLDAVQVPMLIPPDRSRQSNLL